VQQFDLGQLVQEYEQARAGDPTLDRWALMNRLLDARLAASDTEALGGDLAYQYGMSGSLAGIGLPAAAASAERAAVRQRGSGAAAVERAADRVDQAELSRPACGGDRATGRPG
jgi:hypothetical protein